MSESDVAMIRRLLAASSSPDDKARLTSLISRLESGDEEARQGAQRELHAMRALGISGVAARSSLKVWERGKKALDDGLVDLFVCQESGRSNSDSRIGRSYMPPPPSSPQLGATKAASAVAAAAAGADEEEKPRRRLSFWQKRRGTQGQSAAGPGAKGVAGLPSPIDESWDVPCDALGSLEWVSKTKAGGGGCVRCRC